PTVGLLWTADGNFADHLMFSPGPHALGKFISRESPSRRAPRNCGQSSARASVELRIETARIAKQNMVFILQSILTEIERRCRLILPRSRALSPRRDVVWRLAAALARRVGSRGAAEEALDPAIAAHPQIRRRVNQTTT